MACDSSKDTRGSGGENQEMITPKATIPRGVAGSVVPHNLKQRHTGLGVTFHKSPDPELTLAEAAAARSSISGKHIAAAQKDNQWQ